MRTQKAQGGDQIEKQMYRMHCSFKLNVLNIIAFMQLCTVIMCVNFFRL